MNSGTNVFSIQVNVVLAVSTIMLRVLMRHLKATAFIDALLVCKGNPENGTEALLPAPNIKEQMVPTAR